MTGQGGLVMRINRDWQKAHPWQVVMKVEESTIHSFVVRIWLEEAATENTPVVWRGSVIHVLDRNKVYFSNLAQLAAFINEHIQTLRIENETRT